MSAIVWFRRDLRVHDHPALAAALASHDEIVPVFCLDDRLLHGRFASGPRTQFMLESLADLHRSLEERGGGLVVLRGRPEEELVRLARDVSATDVYFTRELTPYGRLRGREFDTALEGSGLAAHAFPGLNVIDDVGALTTQTGKPYSVFTPFYRQWVEQPRREVLPAPEQVAVPDGLDRMGAVPSLAELGLEQEVEEPMRGGEREGTTRLESFLESGVRAYKTNHNALGEDRTARLSPYLHFGCVSPRAIEERLGTSEGEGAFRRQLCWRDFYHQVIFCFPGNAREEHQERYRGTLRWSGGDEEFAAWTEGRTGFPLVDAGMRQLRREGWMHNRARLVVGSMLTKELGVDWRRGEWWFMKLLLDGDEANNNGNWQWIASVGTDPAPFFRRMYNPASHQERFDPDGRYVRRYVPELAPVPDKYLREPWTMPAEVQEEVGCVIGRDYPAPIVDRRDARADAAERYRAATATG